MIFYAYSDNTWFSPDSIPGTRQDGADRVSTLILQSGITFLIWGNVFLTTCAVKPLTAGLTDSFEPTAGRRFVSPHPAGTACDDIPGAPQRALPWLLLPLLPRDAPHQECKCSGRYTSQVAQKRLMQGPITFTDESNSWVEKAVINICSPSRVNGGRGMLS